MKALLINGSPRPNGCTFTALTELANTLEAEGIETEIVHVGNKDIRGCIACRRCHSTGSNKCVFDDIVNEVAPKLAEADAFVIGAPVYFGSPAGGAILPAPCTASHRNNAPAAFARCASRPVGWIVPISLLTCITATNLASSGNGTSGSITPSAPTGSSKSEPNQRAVSRTAACSIADKATGP